MQNKPLRTATGCTQDTNITHLHDKTLILSIHEHIQLHASQYKQKTQPPSHHLNKHTKYFNTPRLETLSSTNIPRNPHIITTTDINIHIHTSIVSSNLDTRGNNKILCTPPPQISSSEEIFPRLTLRNLAHIRTNKSPFPKSYFYTESMPNDIHHHYAHFVILTQITHIISSTAPTYTPHCHPRI